MKSLFARAVVTFAASAGILFGYWIWYGIVADKSSAVASLQDQITTKTETASRIASARVALSEIAGDEDIVRNYFISEDGVVAFINDLEAHGRAQGAEVSVLSVSTNTSSTSPSLLLSLSIKGPFSSVLRTVGTIEYAPYDLSIPELSVVQDVKNVWRADFKILVGSVKMNTP